MIKLLLIWTVHGLINTCGIQAYNKYINHYLHSFTSIYNLLTIISLYTLCPSSQVYHGLHISLGCWQSSELCEEDSSAVTMRATSPLASLAILRTRTRSLLWPSGTTPWLTLYLSWRNWTCFTAISRISAFSSLAVLDFASSCDWKYTFT